ncbi:MAG TPA: amidohydrolase family protein [Tepidisphaeraceae bacterium]|nr:amidohydrolase family protein [Tepidisphaeraceae bacterium]
MAIDSHHHFWSYNPREYGWIKESMSILRRDFLPRDLKTEIAQAGIEGVVSVQARQSLAETQWLLELAQGNDFIHGVVGWVPLCSSGLRGELERLAGRTKLKAVRHVLQDEPDDDFMLRPDFDRGIAALKEFGLRYDILIFERQLPAAIQLVDRHPELTFILDHIAKPRIKENVVSPWRANLAELARRPNVHCKLSGLVTEADHRSWTEAQLRPYLDAALEAFGPRRLMFGSDWPVCLLACGYRRWYEIVRQFASSLSSSERARLLGGTAVEAYGLS